MKQRLKNIKQFIIKHDELFFTLIFFIIIFGQTVFMEIIAEDELWNFQNIYKMYNGYRIYIDANVITTPLFHVLGLIIFKIFGVNFFIFRLYGIVVSTILILQCYKIFKILTNSKISSLFLSNLLFLVNSYIFITRSNYNTLSFVFVFFGILIIFNRTRYTDNKFLILQSIIIFLIFITKQTIGVFYIIGYILYGILYEKKMNIKNISKMAILILILGSLFISILNEYGVLQGFISYTILGIKEFSQKNIFIENSSFIKLLVVLFCYIVIFIFIIKNKIPIKKEIKILSCFSFPFLLIAYPLFNYFHIDLACCIIYIILFYILYYEIIDKIFERKLIFKLSIFLIMLFMVIAVFKSSVYFYNIKEYKYDNIYYGAVINEKTKNKIPKIIKYINKSDEDVIVFSTEAAFYMMPLNKSNGYMDEPLLGNFGKEGEDGVIKEIQRMTNTKILINKEKKSYQESDKIRQYIKDNLSYIGEIEDFLIYQTKGEE